VAHHADRLWEFCQAGDPLPGFLYFAQRNGPNWFKRRVHRLVGVR